jgi:DNA-binding transcriptional MocR family regulator
MLRLRDVPLERGAELIARAERAAVRVYSPALFYAAPRHRSEAELVLGYGAFGPDQIRSGIARLSRVLRDTRNDQQATIFTSLPRPRKSSALRV